MLNSDGNKNKKKVKKNKIKKKKLGVTSVADRKGNLLQYYKNTRVITRAKTITMHHLVTNEPGAVGIVNKIGKTKKMCACDYFLLKLQCRYLTLHFGVKARGNNFKLIFTHTESRARW